MVRRYYLKNFNNSYVLPDNRNAKRVAQHNSQWRLPVYLVMQKGRLTRDERYNDMKTAKVRADDNKLCPGKV